MKAPVIPIRPAQLAEPTLSDESLLLACASSDPAALAALYDRHASAVARFLSRLSYVDACQIEDLVHDAFLAVFRGASSYRRSASVRTWIFAIAANVARESSRAAKRRRSLHASYGEGAPVGSASRPDVELAHRQSLTRAAAVLAELPHETRVAFVMCDLEEVPGVEAARVLEIPVGTLYRRIHEARCAMRRAIEEEAR